MSHNALIKDADPYFEIDSITRIIQNKSSSKTTVIQYDHNSERFTFSLPKEIEGHNMLECNRVEVHYINIEAGTKTQNTGLYEIMDLQADPEDESKVFCTWLLSQNATKLVGSLNFLLRFSCVEDDGTISYAWNTAVHTQISVSAGMYNTETIVKQNADILEQWKTELNNNFIVTATATITKSTSNGDTLAIKNVSATFEEIMNAHEKGKNIELRCDFEGAELIAEFAIIEGTDIGFSIVNPMIGTFSINCHIESGWSGYLYPVVFKKDIITLETQIGDIGTACDNIIAIQNTLIGGETV